MKFMSERKIDDNLINSLVEPIPDLEQHSKIQKIGVNATIINITNF